MEAHTNGSNQYHSYAVKSMFYCFFPHFASFHRSPTTFPRCLEGHFLSSSDMHVMTTSKAVSVWEVLGVARQFLVHLFQDQTVDNYYLNPNVLVFHATRILQCSDAVIERLRFGISQAIVCSSLSAISLVLWPWLYAF